MSFACQLSFDHQFIKVESDDLGEVISLPGLHLSFDLNSSVFQCGQAFEYFVVLSGKIFNLVDLLEEHSLCLHGANLIENLVHLRKIYGRHVAEVLRGDFLLAFVFLPVLDIEIIKTPFSFKVLYYSVEGSRFCFSNSFQRLKKVLSSCLQIDPEKLLDSLSKNYFLSNKTFYKGIFQLESAQTVSWSPSFGLSCRVFWMAESKVSPRSLSCYAEGLREKLESAVKNRLDQESDVCCEISGGLDSTSVAALLARQGLNLLGLSDYSKPSNTCSGLELKDGITNHRFLLDFEVMYPKTRIFRCDGFSLSKNHSDVTRFCFEHSQGPEHAPSNVIWILFFNELAHQLGFKKIFSGRVGDMAFSFRVPPNAEGFFGYLRPALSRVKKSLFSLFSLNHSHAFLLRKEILKKLPPHPGIGLNAIRDLNQRRLEKINFFKKNMVALSNIAGAAFNQYGVELVDPTSDLDLIDYCLTIPAQAYQQNGMNRYITREAMREILPESVRLNQIKGIQAAHWYVPLKREIAYYKSLLPKFSKNDLITEIIDLPRLGELLHEFEVLPLNKLSVNHRLHLVHALHVCEWVILHDS